MTTTLRTRAGVHTTLINAANALMPAVHPAAIQANASLDLRSWSQSGSLFHLQSTITTALVLVDDATAAADKAGGVKLYDFPEGLVQILACRLRGTLSLSAPTATMDTAAEIGLGTVIGTGAVAVLNGTAAFEDIMTGQPTASELGAGTTEACNFHTGMITTIFNGLSTAIDLHLNAAGTFQVATTDLLFDVGNIIDVWGLLIADAL